MLSKYKSQSIILIAVSMILLAQLACISSTSEDQEATVEALAQALSLTATSGASSGAGSVDTVKTAEARATQNALSVVQTQAAQEALSSSDQAATATAVAPILRELPKYDVDPEEGYVSWIYPPVTLEVEEYMSSKFENRFLFTTIKDFAISADITWNTQYGTSGCGFVLRSDGQEEKGNSYMIIISRAAEGHVIFLTIANGELAKMEDMYIPLNDPKFSDKNDETNRLTVVGRENIFTIYTNGYLIGEVVGGEPPSQASFPTRPPEPEGQLAGEALDRYNRMMAQYEEELEQAQASYQAQMRVYQQYNTDYREGFMTLGAVNESGRTVCQFDNTWLFTIVGQ